MMEQVKRHCEWEESGHKESKKIISSWYKLKRSNPLVN